MKRALVWLSVLLALSLIVTGVMLYNNGSQSVRLADAREQLLACRLELKAEREKAAAAPETALPDEGEGEGTALVEPVDALAAERLESRRLADRCAALEREADSLRARLERQATTIGLYQQIVKTTVRSEADAQVAARDGALYAMPE